MFRLEPYNRRSNVAYFNPFQELENFGRDFFRDTDRMVFRTDIKEEDSRYILEAELPGFSKEDINIDIEGDALTISAKREAETEESSEGGKYIHRERSFGTYSRTFDISNIEGKDIKANYTDGILSVTLPKKADMLPESRRLEIE